MKVDDLWDKTIKEVLEDYCILYSPECDYNYGICRWDDANAMYEEYDLEDGFYPDRGSCSESFIPDFDLSGI